MDICKDEFWDNRKERLRPIIDKLDLKAFKWYSDDTFVQNLLPDNF